MGFVEKLWDETVAGPSPETTSSSFRKVVVGDNNVIQLRPISTTPRAAPPVSRSITLLRTRSLPVAPPAAASGGGSDDPSSPSSPLTPGTPSDELRRTLSRTHTPTSLESIQPSDFTTAPPTALYRFR